MNQTTRLFIFAVMLMGLSTAMMVGSVPARAADTLDRTVLTAGSPPAGRPLAVDAPDAAVVLARRRVARPIHRRAGKARLPGCPPGVRMHRPHLGTSSESVPPVMSEPVHFRP